MDSSWLKQRRESAGFTQDALATATKMDVRAIRRLETCSQEAKKQVPYPALAEALNCCEIELAEAHARDLKAAGQHARAEQAREAADQARRKRHFSKVDPRPIERALERCRSTALPVLISERDENLADTESQAKRIAALLGDGNLDGLAGLLDLPLEATIERASSAGEIDALKRLLTTIVQSCTADGAGAEAGQAHQHHGEPKAWPFRALIDHAERLDGLSTLRPAPGTREARLDDGIDSTRAIRPGLVTQQNVDGRLLELVCRIGDTLGTVDHEKPRSADTDGFSAYCNAVNNELFRHNHRHSHVFALWDDCNREPEIVKQRLLVLLPNLRLFDCGDPNRPSSVMRVEGAGRDKLETWFASHLRALEARRTRVPRTAESLSPAAEHQTTKEQPAMHQQAPSAVQNINVNVVNGNANTAGQAAGEARINQRIEEGPPEKLTEQLEALLDAVMTETRADKSGYADLRQATRDAQGELERAGSVSEPVKTRLQRAKDALPAADKVVSMAKNAIETICKLWSLTP